MSVFFPPNCTKNNAINYSNTVNIGRKRRIWVELKCMFKVSVSYKPLLTAFKTLEQGRVLILKMPFSLIFSVWVIVMCGVSILWIPVVERFQGGQMFLYIQAISSYLAPPICALYMLAVLWKRVNEFVSIVVE